MSHNGKRAPLSPFHERHIQQTLSPLQTLHLFNFFIALNKHSHSTWFKLKREIKVWFNTDKMSLITFNYNLSLMSSNCFCHLNFYTQMTVASESNPANTALLQKYQSVYKHCCLWWCYWFIKPHPWISAVGFLYTSTFQEKGDHDYVQGSIWDVFFCTGEILIKLLLLCCIIFKHNPAWEA